MPVGQRAHRHAVHALPVHDRRRLDDGAQRQVGDLPAVGQVDRQVIVVARAGHRSRSALQRAFAVGLAQLVDRRFAGSHCGDLARGPRRAAGPLRSQSYRLMSYFSHGLVTGSLSQGRYSHRCSSPGIGNRPKASKTRRVSGSKVGSKAAQRSREQRVEVLAGAPVAQVQHPGEVVQPGGLDVQLLHRLARHLAEQRPDVRVGMAC